MNDFIFTAGVSLVTCFACFVCVPTLLAFARAFGLYVVINECECRVYTLFGKVEAIIDEPGLHFPFNFLGMKAFILNFFGQCHVLDLSLDQQYLRSQPVNSEEGAPMGIGVWYEMRVTDPVSYLFKNSDPRGSLRANVSNATVRCLSNLKLGEMMENRHAMSRSVRDEVSPKSEEWGYTLGSVYIRKVHFRDEAMIKQIEQKVVNRLRQVTGAIQQDGANQVAVISSNAARVAATEIARAAAMRPYIVGLALQKISQDPEVARVMFEILENQKMLEGKVDVTLIPAGLRHDVMTQLLAAKAQ
jgi:regulator of protease activity HflC (stomatin/prohibitin superfamily)